MPARTQKKQLSLDANIVFDLAERKDFAHDFREVFQGKGYALVLPPTAVHELHLFSPKAKARLNENWPGLRCLT